MVKALALGANPRPWARVRTSSSTSLNLLDSLSLVPCRSFASRGLTDAARAPPERCNCRHRPARLLSDHVAALAWGASNACPACPQEAVYGTAEQMAQTWMENRLNQPDRPPRSSAGGYNSRNGGGGNGGGGGGGGYGGGRRRRALQLGASADVQGFRCGTGSRTCTCKAQLAAAAWLPQASGCRADAGVWCAGKTASRTLALTTVRGMTTSGTEHVACSMSAHPRLPSRRDERCAMRQASEQPGELVCRCPRRAHRPRCWLTMTAESSTCVLHRDLRLGSRSLDVYTGLHPRDLAILCRGLSRPQCVTQWLCS